MGTNKRIIERTIEFVCEALKLQTPPYEYAADELLGTKMAAIALPEKTLLVKKGLRYPEIVLAIAHELRNLYQYEHGLYKNELRSGETYTDSSEDMDRYIRQKCEIDANAFASIVCQELVRCKPMFRPYPDDVRLAIEKRVIQILDEEFPLE